MKRLIKSLSVILILIVVVSFVSSQMPITKPFYVRIADLVDVLRTTPTDNYLLIYDSSTGLWGPEAITGAGGINISGTPVDNDFAKFTDGDTVEGRSYAETLSDLSGEATASVVFDWNMAHLGNIQRIRGCDDHNFNIYSNNLTTAATERDMIFWTLDATGNSFIEVFRLNATSTAPTLDISKAVNFADGTDTHIVKAVQETGLGGRLTFGLDETARTLVICDAGDVDADFGLAAASDPSVYVYNAAANTYSQFTPTQIAINNGVLILKNAGTTSIIDTWSPLQCRARTDLAIGDMFTFDSWASIELTDANAEQSWIYIEPEINQTSTAAWNGLKLNATITGEGDASTGAVDENTLVALEADSVPLWNVCIEKIVKAHDSDLFDADAVTDQVAIFTIPANSILMSVIMRLETQFAGIDDLKVEVGPNGGDIDGLLVPGAMDLTGDAADSDYSNHGALWDNASGRGGFYYFDSSQQIDAKATTTDGDGLDETSAGSVTFYFTYMKLVTTT